MNTPLMGPAYGPQDHRTAPPPGASRSNAAKTGAPEDRFFPEDENDFKELVTYFDLPSISLKDPLVSPAYHPSVLAAFPPSLLITGTRDANLSGVVYTHAQLIKAGVESDLHIWEGAHHCSYAGAMMYADVPETREALNVIVKFFDKHLGK
jgi:acetyl esterase/lipase